MLRHLAGASALALTLAGAGFAQDHDHDHEDVTLYRVFVGDHEKGQVTAFDLAEPDHRWTFPTTGQVKLYSVAGGAVVAAVQSDADTVQFIRSGISFHDHGDHRDIEVGDPAAIDASLTGPRPFHLVEHDGKVVLNYDQGGYARSSMATRWRKARPSRQVPAGPRPSRLRRAPGGQLAVHRRLGREGRGRRLGAASGPASL